VAFYGITRFPHKLIARIDGTTYMFYGIPLEDEQPVPDDELLYDGPTGLGDAEQVKYNIDPTNWLVGIVKHAILNAFGEYAYVLRAGDAWKYVLEAAGPDGLPEDHPDVHQVRTIFWMAWRDIKAQMKANSERGTAAN
jgi:hypothetical protein